MWNELRVAPDDAAFSPKFVEEDPFPRRLPSAGRGFRDDEFMCLGTSRYDFNYDHPGTPEIHACKWDTRSYHTANLERMLESSRTSEVHGVFSNPAFAPEIRTPEVHPSYCGRRPYDLRPGFPPQKLMSDPYLPLQGYPYASGPGEPELPQERWGAWTEWKDQQEWWGQDEWGYRHTVYNGSHQYDIPTPSTIAPHGWGHTLDSQNSPWGQTQSTAGTTRPNSPSSTDQFSQMEASSTPNAVCPPSSNHLSPCMQKPRTSWRTTQEAVPSPRSTSVAAPAPNCRNSEQGEVQRYEAAIHRCAKERQWEKALEILQDMRKNTSGATVRAFTSAISACAKMGRSQEALDLLKEMQKVGVKPNVLTYSAAISACEKARKWKPALNLLEEIKKNGVEPDVITYNAAISACEKARQWRPALLLIREMRDDAKVKPDVISYSAAISACEKGGKLEQALQLFNEMKEQNIKPDVILYNATISACDKRGAWEEAIRLLREMRANNVKPDVITYSTAITACSRGGKADQAVSLLREMREHLVKPNGMAFLAAIGACSKQGKQAECQELLREMRELGFMHEKGGVWKRALSMVRRGEVGSE